MPRTIKKWGWMRFLKGKISGRIKLRPSCPLPMFIETPFSKPMFEKEGFREYVLGNIPLRRVGQPEDITGAVIYLASEASNLVTGHILLIDGGWTAH